MANKPRLPATASTVAGRPHGPGGASSPRGGGWYQIRVDGLLDAHWQDEFFPMQLTAETARQTTLRGFVADQAALHGLLRRIGDLGLVLLHVERLDDTY